MTKLLLLAQGKHIEKYAQQFRDTMDSPEEMEIIFAHMADAVQTARQRIDTDTEVVMARSTTADILRRADIPVPVVEIPVSDEEVIGSIMKARAISADGAPIGFLGFSNIIHAIKTFQDILAFRVKLYEAFTPKDARRQIERAKKDGVAVLISGEGYRGMVRAAGLKNVLMDSSVSSISRAYQQAKEIMLALNLEKKRNQETHTIFNSVSDAIISLDAEGKLTLVNRHASHIFERSAGDLVGKEFSAVFSPTEQEPIRRVLATGEATSGAIMPRRGRKYAADIVPITVGKRTEGAVVTLQEIHALQRMEATVRKGLYLKGNVAQYVFEDIKGGSAAIRDAVATARSFARLESNILIMGETGTGKELFAQSVHNASPRRSGPFVAVNCGAIPAHLVESELFGYEDGAFTGAKKGGKIGLFELAHGGTIFLDEMSGMDTAGQVNLLRALQERQIRRVGGNNVIPVDVRVIAACNADIEAMARDGRFRRDLYYRLSVLVLEIPPLRARREDVAVLSAHFIDQYNTRFGKRVELSGDALSEMESFGWDGNIRQLRNFCERVVAVAEDGCVNGDFVRRQFHHRSWCAPEETPGRWRRPGDVERHAPGGLDNVLYVRGKVFTHGQVGTLLARHGGVRSRVADELGISRTTLWKFLKSLPNHLPADHYGVLNND